MTKADIIKEISEATGLQKKEVAAVIECFMSSIKTSLLERNEAVYLRGFGTFGSKHRAQREALKAFEDSMKEDNYEKRKGFFKNLRDRFS